MRMLTHTYVYAASRAGRASRRSYVCICCLIRMRMQPHAQAAHLVSSSAKEARFACFTSDGEGGGRMSLWRQRL